MRIFSVCAFSAFPLCQKRNNDFCFSFPSFLFDSPDGEERGSRAREREASPWREYKKKDDGTKLFVEALKRGAMTGFSSLL